MVDEKVNKFGRNQTNGLLKHITCYSQQHVKHNSTSLRDFDKSLKI
jgi:hypothetical protein